MCPFGWCPYTVNNLPNHTQRRSYRSGSSTDGPGLRRSTRSPAGCKQEDLAPTRLHRVERARGLSLPARGNYGWCSWILPLLLQDPSAGCPATQKTLPVGRSQTAPRKCFRKLNLVSISRNHVTDFSWGWLLTSLPGAPFLSALTVGVGDGSSPRRQSGCPDSQKRQLTATSEPKHSSQLDQHQAWHQGRGKGWGSRVSEKSSGWARPGWVCIQ